MQPYLNNTSPVWRKRTISSNLEQSKWKIPIGKILNWMKITSDLEQPALVSQFILTDTGLLYIFVLDFQIYDMDKMAFHITLAVQKLGKWLVILTENWNVPCKPRCTNGLNHFFWNLHPHFSKLLQTPMYTTFEGCKNGKVTYTSPAKPTSNHYPDTFRRSFYPYYF